MTFYPAIQNPMLAARALDQGTILTALRRLREAEVQEILGVPGEVQLLAMIPVGYPLRR